MVELQPGTSKRAKTPTGEREAAFYPQGEWSISIDDDFTDRAPSNCPELGPRTTRHDRYLYRVLKFKPKPLLCLWM